MEPQYSQVLVVDIFNQKEDDSLTPPRIIRVVVIITTTERSHEQQTNFWNSIKLYNSSSIFTKTFKLPDRNTTNKQQLDRIEKRFK